MSTETQDAICNLVAQAWRIVREAQEYPDLTPDLVSAEVLLARAHELASTAAD
jgi:hypothetical protein